MRRQHDRIEAYLLRRADCLLRRDRVYKANYLDKPRFKEWLHARKKAMARVAAIAAAVDKVEAKS